MTTMPRTQRELVKLALIRRPAPKPKSPAVNRDYWNR